MKVFKTFAFRTETQNARGVYYVLVWTFQGILFSDNLLYLQSTSVNAQIDQSKLTR